MAAEGQVEALVKGPAVYICNECVALCVEILADRKKEKATP